MFGDSIRNLLGFHETMKKKEYNISPNPLDTLSFDIILFECDIAEGNIFKQIRKGINHICTMTVNLGYEYVESFAGCIIWYMMETKNVISSFFFMSKNEKKRIGIIQRSKHLFLIINQVNLNFNKLNAEDINKIEIASY